MSSLRHLIEETISNTLQSAINSPTLRNVINSPLQTVEQYLTTNHTPTVNLYETPTEYILMVELPGVKKSDIVLTCDVTKVTIKAPKTVFAGSANANPLLEEINKIEYVRTVDLPLGVYKNNISAKLENGILTVMLKKDPSSKVESQAVPIL